MAEETIKKNHDKILSKQEDCIYNLENGRYLVIVQRRIDGKVKTKKARNVKGIQEARAKRRSFIFELNREAVKVKDGQYKWKEAYQKYLDDIEARIEESKKRKKPMGVGSLETAKAAYNYTKHWDKLFLMDISPHHVRNMMSQHGFATKAYAVKKQYMRHIRNAFKFNFGALGNIFLNPAHGIYVERDKNDEPHQVTWIRPEIMQKVFELQHDEDMRPKLGNKWAALFYVCYYTGLRSGEAFALEWDSVHLKDPKNCYIEVKSTYNWKTKTTTPPKSGQTRVVDVTAIANYLRQHKLNSTEKKYVFARDREWQSGKAARAIRAILKEVEYIPEKDHKGREKWPNFHSLRASFIMNYLMANGSPFLLQKMVGHSDWETTQHYIDKLKGIDIAGESKRLNPYTKKARKNG